MRIYLDHNATTPVREEVVAAMLRVLRDCYGNPSSTHAEGAVARGELDRARERVAELIGSRPAEIVFTGSATEANNAAIFGAIRAPGAHLVTTRVEHPSVEEPVAVLEARGIRATRVPVDAEGLVDPGEVSAAITDATVLVSVMLANNETGVLQPIEAIAERTHARGKLLHVDATQAVGKIPVDVGRLGADLLSASAHKFNGPKGAGFLFQRAGVELAPHIQGGPQERRRRGGTENLAGIVGLGVACALAERELPERADGYARLRDRLWEGIQAKVGRVRRNGSPRHMLPNTLNVEFEGIAGEVLLEALDLEGISVSAGAACHSGSIEASHVLTAMGRSPQQARASLRLSVGHGVDDAQIDRVLSVLPDLVERVREVAGA